MRARNAWIVFAALAVLSAGACSRGEQPKELTALDSAYKSGVLTKDEYEAKRLAWSSQVAAREALDKAYQAGVLTKDDYEARKARLTAKVTALAAIEKAYRAGVFSKDEYLAKKSSLLTSEAAAPAALEPGSGMAAAPAPPASEPTPIQVAQTAPVIPVSANNDQPQRPPGQPAAQPAAQPVAAQSAPAGGSSSMGKGQAYRMKQVAVIDAHGFERPMPSSTMLIPVDWQSQGGTEWMLKDVCNTIQTRFRVNAPDGRGIEFFPQFKWSWADDPTFLKRIYAQKAQFGSHACDVMPPMGAADYLRNNIRRIRPQAQLVAIEPVPDLLAEAQRQAQQAEQFWAQARLPRRVRADVARARVKYSLNGQEVEEWFVAHVTVVAVTAPGYSVARGGMVQSTSYDCTALMNAVHAPAGKLEANEKFFKLMISTVRANPEWVARVTKNAQQMQQIELKGIRDRANINAKSADDMRNTQREMYENQQRGTDSRSNDFANYVRDVEDYRNPETGETVKLSNQYGNAWVNNKGEYLLSDQSSFNPNTVSTETWKPLQRVKQ